MLARCFSVNKEYNIIKIFIDKERVEVVLFDVFYKYYEEKILSLHL